MFRIGMGKIFTPKQKIEETEPYKKGFDVGWKAGIKSILGNFDSTGPITKEDFLEIQTILRSNGFELVFNPHKGGFDIRKPLFSEVTEIEILEIEK